MEKENSFKISLNYFLIPFCIFALLSEKIKSFWGDPGLGWHLVLGDYIVQTSSLPKTDSYTFLSSGNFWVLDQWLSDLSIAVVKINFGWSILTALLLLVFVYTFVLRQYQKLCKDYPQGILTSLLIVLTTFFAQIHFIGRPVIFSFLFFSIFFFRLLDITKKAYEPSLSDYLVLCVTLIFWVNMHPSYLIVIPLLFAYYLAGIYSTGIKKSYLYLFLALLVSSIINPYLFNLHFTNIGLTVSQLINPSYSEWNRTETDLTTAFLIATPLLLLALATLRRVLDFKKDLFLILSGIGFCLIAIAAFRFLPYFAIVNSLFVLHLIHSLNFKMTRFFNYPIVSELSFAWQKINQRERGTKGMSAIFTASSILLLVFANRIPQLSNIHGPSGQMYSVKAIEIISKNQQTSNFKEIKVLNDSNLGGSLLYYGKGKYQYLLDDRTTVHSTNAYAYVDDNFKPEKIFSFAKTFKSEYLLLSNGGRYKELVQFFKTEQRGLISYVDADVMLIKFKE